MTQKHLITPTIAAALPTAESEERGYAGWSPGGDYLGWPKEGWTSNQEYATSAEFIEAYAGADPELNLVADFYFTPHTDADDQPDGTFGLLLWMLHPRKGAGRGITVKLVDEGDLDAIKAILRESFVQHQKHFAWAIADTPSP
jgi:hypothetical protein